MIVNELEFRELHLKVVTLSQKLIFNDRLTKDDSINIKLELDIIGKRMRTMILTNELEK